MPSAYQNPNRLLAKDLGKSCVRARPRSDCILPDVVGKMHDSHARKIKEADTQGATQADAPKVPMSRMTQQRLCAAFPRG